MEWQHDRASAKEITFRKATSSSFVARTTLSVRFCELHLTWCHRQCCYLQVPVVRAKLQGEFATGLIRTMNPGILRILTPILFCHALSPMHPALRWFQSAIFLVDPYCALISTLWIQPCKILATSINVHFIFSKVLLRSWVGFRRHQIFAGSLTRVFTSFTGSDKERRNGLKWHLSWCFFAPPACCSTAEGRTIM
jgi:hypothetical protein